MSYFGRRLLSQVDSRRGLGSGRVIHRRYDENGCRMLAMAGNRQTRLGVAVFARDVDRVAGLLNGFSYFGILNKNN